MLPSALCQFHDAESGCLNRTRFHLTVGMQRFLACGEHLAPMLEALGAQGQPRVMVEYRPEREPRPGEPDYVYGARRR